VGKQMFNINHINSLGTMNFSFPGNGEEPSWALNSMMLVKDKLFKQAFQRV
jgi:hypothetical protein